MLEDENVELAFDIIATIVRRTPGFSAADRKEHERLLGVIEDALKLEKGRQ